MVFRVVIVGAGFAGLAAARRLAGAPVEVKVVDQHNYHTFQPLLYQVATAGLDSADVAYPVRTIFRRTPNVRFIHAKVAGLDLPARAVRLDRGLTLDYDYLVVASGAAAAVFGVPGVREHALFLYTLDDARWVRNQVLAVLERADTFASEAAVAPVIVVVGAGPTGVETAGAMAELIDIAISHDCLPIDPQRARVVLLDSQERLLPGFSPVASAYAERRLRREGVEIRLGVPVEAVSAEGVTLRGGEKIGAALVIWAAGVTVDGTIASGLPNQGPGGRVVVGEDLSLRENPEVFVIGDAAAITGSGSSQKNRSSRDRSELMLLPQIAQVAMQSGDHASRQILNIIQGCPTTSFVYRDKGMMATIGRRSAVAQLRSGLSVRGTLGWFAWLLLHLVYLIGFRNRVVVLVNWTWRYLRWPSGPRLILGDLPARHGPADCPECR